VNDAPLIVSRRGATAMLTLNRPQRRNALDLAMRSAIAAAIHEVRDDVTVKSVVITGAQGNFCSGGDLRDFTTENRTVWENRQRVRRLHQWFYELVNLEKPVVMAVDGAAIGAGFNLALAGDFILCSERAKFSASFGRVGLVPDLGGFFLLPRIVGLQRAKEMIFSARDIPADEALRLGMVYAVRPEATLLEDALALAQQFHSASTETIGMAKNILNQSFHLDQRALIELESYAQAIAFEGAYFREAVGRFLKREWPLFDWSAPFDRR
jgi:2-(1,2-epoxy-1,2-dihydrophenyl)acetyl-CoA isomerase